MQKQGLSYSFSAIPWQYAGPAGWVFVTIPAPVSTSIRKALKDEEQGWGRLQVTAQTGNTEWKTAIWWDSKANAYLLPLKAEIRKKEKISPEQKLTVNLII